MIHLGALTGVTRVLSCTIVALCSIHPLPGRAQGPDAWNEGFVKTPDGLNIHYLEAGAGPALVFVPGWTMPADIWEHQIAHFSQRYRVVAMDPRSQGESSRATEGHYSAARARDIKAVID